MKAQVLALFLMGILTGSGCAAFSQTDNWTDTPFDPQKAAEVLLKNKMISAAERDSIRMYARGAPSVFERDFPDQHFDWSERSSFLACLLILKYQTPDEVYSRYLAVTDSLPWEEAIHDPAVQYMELRSYGYPVPGISFYDTQYHQPLHDSLEARIGKLVNILVAADLTTPGVWEEIRTMPESHFWFFLANYSFSSLCGELMRITSRYELFDSLKAEELGKARALLEAGVMDASGFDRLENSYITGQLKDNAGLVPFCKQGIILSLENNSAAADLLPDLATRLLSVAGLHGSEVSLSEPTFISVPYTWNPIYIYTETRALLSITIEGVRWNQHVYLGDRDPDSSLFSEYLSNSLQQLINKVLAWKGSEYRLHQIKFSASPDSPDPRRCAFVMLKEGQYDIWKLKQDSELLLGEYQYSSALSPEIFDPRLSPQGLSSFWAELDSIGLLAHLSAAERDSCWREISAHAFRWPDDVFTAIPRLCGGFKFYDVGGGMPIAEQLNDMQYISRGLFRISDAKDNFPNENQGKGRYSVSFSWNGKRQHWRLHSDDYDALDFWRRMSDFLRDNAPGITITDLPVAHHMSMFLTLDQMRVIVRRFPDWKREE